MKLLYLIAVTLALVAAAPKPNKLQFRNLYKHPIRDFKIGSNPRIINGQEAEPHSIPYSAFLEVYSEEEGWYCGGSLISENYVLTAGHCGFEAVRAQVTLGAHKPLEDENSQIIIVSTDITVHKDYDDDTLENDISVIRLPEAVTLSAEIQVVALPSRAESENSYQGATARISGWGLTDGFGSTVSDVLNYVDVEVISNNECERIFEIFSSTICTSGSELSGSCNGDSGGPLVVDGTQIGVVSFGMIFCLPGFPSGFSRVTSFLDWIEENTDVVVK